MMNMKNLSGRELEVLKLIMDEHSSSEIAEKLNVSVRTVDTHRKNIMQKSGARNMIGLFKFALEKKIVEL